MGLLWKVILLQSSEGVFFSTFGIPAGGKKQFRLAWFKACLKSISFFQDILKKN